MGESERTGVTGGSLAKMGGQVALASTVSRITGFVRTLALAAVLGIAWSVMRTTRPTASRTWSISSSSAGFSPAFCFRI